MLLITQMSYITQIECLCYFHNKHTKDNKNTKKTETNRRKRNFSNILSCSKKKKRIFSTLFGEKNNNQRRCGEDFFAVLFHSFFELFPIFSLCWCGEVMDFCHLLVEMMSFWSLFFSTENLPLNFQSISSKFIGN